MIINKEPRKKTLWRGGTIQLFLIAILPLTAMVLIITFGSLSLHMQAMRNLVADRNLRAVRSAALSISKEIEHRVVLIETIANFADSLGNDKALLSFMEQQSSGFDKGAVIINSNGEIINGNSDQVLLLIENTEMLIGLEDSTAELEFGDVRYLPTVQSQDSFFTPIITRIDSDKFLVGVFSMEEAINNAISLSTQESNLNIIAIDQENRSIFQSTHTDTDSFFISQISRLDGNESSGETIFKNERGEYIISWSVIPIVNWRLVYFESWHEISSPLLSTTQYAPLIIIPLLAFAILALWFGFRQIVLPMQKLEDQAAQLAKGKFESIQQPVGGVQEISSLQRTLIVMAEKLQEAQLSLHNYIGAITNSVEKERQKIARDLHDVTIQSFIALSQQAQYALHWNNNPRVKKPLKQIKSTADENVKDLRRMIQGLRPIYIEDLGLATALSSLVSEVKENTDMESRFILSGVERRLPPDIEMALYRIAQEAVNNAKFHSQAKILIIDMKFNQDTLELEIKDDGIGFDIPTESMHYALRGHYGVLGMYERSELIGANFEIESQKGKGSKVYINLPLRPKQ